MNNYVNFQRQQKALELYRKGLNQNEINTTYNWIRQVTRVTVQARTPIVLTSYRAKKLINQINKINTL